MRTADRHPAYGQINVSRVSAGGAGYALYGSDFRHHHFMTLRISRSERRRNLSHDWYHEREQLIEVHMSEAQWATFVSSPNVGSGAQCTLSRIGVEAVPEPPAPVRRDEQFQAEARSVIEAALVEIDALAAASLAKAAQHLRANLSFVLRSFDEHVERTVERAKAEINAYAGQRGLTREEQPSLTDGSGSS